MKTMKIQPGFTLIEVLVASSLAMGLALVIMTFAIQAQQMATVMITKSQLNAEARLIFEMLGTGQAIDSIQAPNNIIENTELSEGLREVAPVAPNIINTILSANANPPAAINSGTSTIKVDSSLGKQNLLVITPTTTTTTTLNPRQSSATNTINVPCRTTGDPYFDCQDNVPTLTSNGYVSSVMINRSVETRTVDVEYTLVDPRLAGWHDQAYTQWDYRETYRTSFLMPIQ